MNDSARPVTAASDAGLVPASDLRSGTALLGAGVVVIWNDVKPEGRDAFYGWHDKEHIPERLALPGFLRGRRYRCEGHSPEWLTLYEAADLGAVSSREYLARLNAPTPLTKATLVHFANTSRAVCIKSASLGSSSGGFVLALRLDPTDEFLRAWRGGGDAQPTGDAAASRGDSIAIARAGAVAAKCAAWAVSDRLESACATNGIVAAHYLATDVASSYTSTAESKTRRFDVPAAVVLVEATNPDAARSARDRLIGDSWSEHGLTVRADHAVYALEISRLAQAEANTPSSGEH